MTPKVPKPQTSTTTQVVDTAAADQAAAEEQARVRKKRGSQSTRLTLYSPTGTGLGNANTGGSSTLGTK